MTRRSIQRVAGLLVLMAGVVPAVRGEEASVAPIRIGVVSSLFRDTAPSLIDVLSRPLLSLMETQTGMTGEMAIGGDAVELATKLKENQIQLAVMHGFEFAWARQHCPELKPLVICVAHHPRLHAHLIVRKDSPAESCADLKGKVIALPAISRAQLHLYLERRCPAPGSDPKKFFAEVRRPMDPEEALDDILRGTVDAAIVERIALDEYQQNKPARLNRLRVLHQSETFPPSVIAYHPGSLDEAVLKRFREGLVAASRSPRGVVLLKMCRITGFAEVPADYDALLTDILKAYPPPVKQK